jgi:hypothetical protein
LWFEGAYVIILKCDELYASTGALRKVNGYIHSKHRKPDVAISTTFQVSHSPNLFSTMLSALRSSAARAARPLKSQQTALRFVSSTPRVLGDHGPKPPSLIGEGAKAGEVPTDLNQSTGLERFQIMGNLQGVDVFGMEPLVLTKLGTKAEPTVIPSLVCPV